eukprot:1159686-Pelagomonas_calceolata.AAC.5
MRTAGVEERALADAFVSGLAHRAGVLTAHDPEGTASQATLSQYVTLFAGYASVWMHKMRVAKGEEEAPEHGYQLNGELGRCKKPRPGECKASKTHLFSLKMFLGVASRAFFHVTFQALHKRFSKTAQIGTSIGCREDSKNQRLADGAFGEGRQQGSVALELKMYERTTVWHSKHQDQGFLPRPDEVINFTPAPVCVCGKGQKQGKGLSLRLHHSEDASLMIVFTSWPVLKRHPTFMCVNMRTLHLEAVEPKAAILTLSLPRQIVLIVGLFL